MASLHETLQLITGESDEEFLGFDSAEVRDLDGDTSSVELSSVSVFVF